MIRLVWVGRTKPGPAATWIEEYRRRLERYCTLEIVEVPDAPGRSHGRSRASREAKSLLEKIPSRGLVVTLDESGESMTSARFARFLERALASRSEVTFILGGPDGIAPEVAGASSAMLSLSPLTLTHEMARVVLLEQIYRAFTILKGGAYHR